MTDRSPSPATSSAPATEPAWSTPGAQGGVRVLADDGDLLGNRPVPGGEGQRRGHRDTLQGVGAEQGDDHVRK